MTNPDSALPDDLDRWRSSLEADDGSVITSDELWLLIDLIRLPWRCGPNVEAPGGPSSPARRATHGPTHC